MCAAHWAAVRAVQLQEAVDDELDLNGCQALLLVAKTLPGLVDEPLAALLANALEPDCSAVRCRQTRPRLLRAWLVETSRRARTARLLTAEGCCRDTRLLCWPAWSRIVRNCPRCAFMQSEECLEASVVVLNALILASRVHTASGQPVLLPLLAGLAASGLPRRLAEHADDPLVSAPTQ